ncbi:MFS transporter [Candidatus Roizmanbacteria bacterium]|nr:MFS transporter [Candidatus Roizmanbacteria bacterium]
MKDKLQSNIWKFYVINLLTGLHFVVPIRIMYLLSFGLSYTQIGLMELGAAITIFILEIPSGIFADLVGRKASRIVAYVFSFSGFALMSISSTAPFFILGWALSGAADAFESGATDALIYDTLKGLGKQEEYAKLKSRLLLILTTVMIIGSITGAYLYVIDRRLPWYLFTGIIVLSFLLFLTVIEPKRTSEEKLVSKSIASFRQSLVVSLNNREVIELIIFTVLLALPMYLFGSLVSQPYFVSKGFTVSSLGYIFAFIVGISGFLASFSHVLDRRLKKKYSLFLIFISFTILMTLMGIVKTQYAILFVLGFYFIDSYKNIVMDAYINKLIDSESRASVLSVISFMKNTIAAVVFVGIGYLVDRYKIDTVLIGMGIAVSLIAIPITVSLNYAKKIHIKT